MIKEKSCGAIVYRKNNKIEFLLLKHNAGHYTFPKGHVENNETEEETAIREIKEETNIEVKLDTNFRYIVTYSPKPNVTKDVIYFIAEKTNGIETPQETEIELLKWAEKEEALNLITYDNDKQVLINAIKYLEG